MLMDTCSGEVEMGFPVGFLYLWFPYLPGVCVHGIQPPPPPPDTGHACTAYATTPTKPSTVTLLEFCPLPQLLLHGQKNITLFLCEYVEENKKKLIIVSFSKL